MTDATVRNTLITAVSQYAADGGNSQPFPDLYDSINGIEVSGSGHARPVVGGHFALVCILALPS